MGHHRVFSCIGVLPSSGLHYGVAIDDVSPRSPRSHQSQVPAIADDRSALTTSIISLLPIGGRCSTNPIDNGRHLED
ncbi:hypothetical protein PTI98_002200 [Pleurotus ostreatus]|nr:hypothetical protein PTI98_002200 [Pleurotus ostreatus]